MKTLNYEALVAEIKAAQENCKKGIAPPGAMFKRLDGRYVFYFTPAEVAIMLRVSTKKLERWRKRGEGPPCKKISTGQIRYDACAFSDWYEATPGYGAPP